MEINREEMETDYLQKYKPNTTGNVCLKDVEHLTTTLEDVDQLNLFNFGKKNEIHKIMWNKTDKQLKLALALYYNDKWGELIKLLTDWKFPLEPECDLDDEDLKI